MYKQENAKIMSLYAIAPVHAGSGSSMGIVDLPVQRERHTNWPHIQASGVKGAMRHHFERFKNSLEGNLDNDIQLNDITKMIFGDSEYEDGTAGAVAVSDAKLLAFPMRSNKAPFVWVTCPAVLARLSKDLKMVGMESDNEPAESLTFEENNAIALSDGFSQEDKVLLEDYEVNVCEVKQGLLSGTAAKMLEKAERLLLVNNDVFRYAVNNCTEVQAQIKIDPVKGTTDPGTLRYEELVPGDTLMYSILMYGNTRTVKETITADTLISYIKDTVVKNHIQIGGDETLGRGIFEIEWLGKDGDE